MVTLKGTLGRKGGGVILSPDGNQELSYSWGLGIESNNMAEALALWQGLILAKNHGIKDIVVIGDSRLVSQALNSGNLPEDMKILHMIKKIQSISSFQTFEAFHMLWSKNAWAANMTSSLARGTLDLNGRKTWSPIP